MEESNVVLGTSPEGSTPQMENTVEAGSQEEPIEVTTEGEVDTEVDESGEEDSSEGSEEDHDSDDSDPDKPSKAQQRIEALVRKNKEVIETARQAAAQRDQALARVESLERAQQAYERLKASSEVPEEGLSIDELRKLVREEAQQEARQLEIQRGQEQVLLTSAQVELGKAVQSLPILVKSQAAGELFSSFWASHGTATLSNGEVVPTAPADQTIKAFKELLPELVKDYNEDITREASAKDGVLKGIKSPRQVASSNSPKLTREAIASMSTAEYEKRRPEIERAMQKGIL
jgi:hypothetical protein